MTVDFKTRIPYVALSIVAVLAVLAYLPGLSGPFLFDDAPHITKNTQVQITDLSTDSLIRAWNSSHLSGTGSRPLAQVSFGINHALSALTPTNFKATNLTIHLLNGLLIFALVTQISRVLARATPSQAWSYWPAVVAASLWLLHPINLTPVLYIVQRMTSLSALFVLAGLWCHVTGRLLMSDGKSHGFLLALAGLPIALTGILAKETALLYPLMLLALEWSLLRRLESPKRGLLLVIVSGLPLLAGAVYFWTHPWFIDFSHRDFTLSDRLLSEARVLWLYLQMLVMPDLSALGLYHDDIVTSRSLLTPWTTLPATLSWVVLTPLALVLAKRWPIASFGLLFFLAGHAMESTIFPLELVFEHRNYLPSLGPIFAISWFLTYPYPPRARRLAGLATILAVIVFTLLTHLRARDWSDHVRLAVTEVHHHPDSARANFLTAQILMDRIGQSGVDSDTVYQAAHSHLERVRQIEPSNINALFGLMLLELFVNRDPAPELLQSLLDQLRNGVVDPTKLTTGQFSFLVRWQQHEGTHKLSHQQVLAIFDAALHNPGLNNSARAGVLSAARAYYDLVLHDAAAALPYAQKAVQASPARWHYHYRLVQLLIRLGKLDEARAAFQYAIAQPSAALNQAQVDGLALALKTAQ